MYIRKQMILTIALSACMMGCENGESNTNIPLVQDAEASNSTMEALEQLELGAQIGDSGFTWGTEVGGLGTGTPTTDGYGNGVEITIEPMQ